MLRPLAYYGNPILRKKTQPVAEINDEIRKLVADMVETMEAKSGGGLAAPQVHESLSLFITHASIPKEVNGKVEWFPGVLRVFINPKLFAPSKEVWTMDEGCLSLPGLYVEVERPWKINIEAMGLDGKLFTQEFEGLEARVVMHENDHIKGVLTIDRVHGKKRQEIEKALREIKQKYNK